MAFLDFLRPKPAVKPLSFSEPIFIKENSSTKNQIEKLEKWKELIIPEQADRLTKDIKKLTSGLNGEKFDFDSLIRTPMRSINDFLEDNEKVSNVYDVTQPSILSCIGEKSIRRATVIKDYAYTITTRQDRTPAQVIDCGNGRYRYLTERECWRLMGYTDADFEAAKAVHRRRGRYYTALYAQAGNSIAVPIFESIFRKIILNESGTKEARKPMPGQRTIFEYLEDEE